MGEEWFEVLKDEFTLNYMVYLGKTIARQRQLGKIYPEKENVFRAFRETPYSKVRVVILGQDPYHDGSATGLAFANEGVDVKTASPSLKKIYEYLGLAYDMGYINFPPLTDWTLDRWSSQGVLLLNRVLTVKRGLADSHKDLGWETFTDRVINKINQKDYTVVFMLWGRKAQSVKRLIDRDSHIIYECEHPAAASYDHRIWDTKQCFIKLNKHLKAVGEKEILW